MALTTEIRQAHRHRLTLLALWLLFYASFALVTPPLLDDADSVHAEVAREMLLRHDPITLYANGIRYLEKAPLYYWSMAAAMRVYGPTTAAARVPLAYAVLALTLLLESFARRAFASPRAGLYAGLITLSSFGIFIFSRINIPDILVCLFLTAALFCFYLTEQQPLPSLALCCLLDTFLALNILTKGLIGIVFPVAIVAAHLLFTRGLRGTLRRLAQFHPVASTATLLVIAAPWHILIALDNPAHGHPAGFTHTGGHWHLPYPTEGNVHSWAWFYFLNEQLFRYLNLRIPHDYDTSPLWLFLGLIFIWLLPWSAFLPTSLVRACRTLRVPHDHLKRSGRLSWAEAGPLRTLPPTARLNLLLLLWITLPLAFFLFSTRQEYYVLPTLPPMILLTANLLATPDKVPDVRQFDSLTVNPRKYLCQLPTTILLILGTLTSATILIFLLRTHSPSPTTDLATLLHQNPADYALSFGHFLDLTGPSLALFRLPLTLTALAFFLGPLAHYLLRRAAKPHAATLSLTAAAFLFLLAAHQGLVTFSPTLTSAQLAQTIAPHLHPQDLLAIHGEYESASTLGFYLKRNNLHIIEGRSSNLWYGSFFPDAPKIFETPESIAQKWPGPQRIFLWQDPHDPDRPPLQLPAPVYILATSGGKQILSNQP